MSLIDHFLKEEIIMQAWQQLQRMLSSEGRFRQLISLRPIELYNTSTKFEVDGAIIEIEMESFLENIIQKRIDHAANLLALGKWVLNESRAYNFHVVVTARIDYNNAAIYLNNHFAGKDYYFDNNKYHLHIEQIRLREEKHVVIADVDAHGYVKSGFLTKKAKGTMVIHAHPVYINDKSLFSTRDLNYHIRHTDLLTRGISWWWHNDIRTLLQHTLEYPLEEDLFNGRVMAQEEMNRHQKQPTFWVNGMLTSLSLERIYYDQEGLQAVLLARGKLERRR
jgi:hypothetical protein